LTFPYAGRCSQSFHAEVKIGKMQQLHPQSTGRRAGPRAGLPQLASTMRPGRACREVRVVDAAGSSVRYRVPDDEALLSRLGGWPASRAKPSDLVPPDRGNVAHRSADR
jgi:hypothetical protein